MTDVAIRCEGIAKQYDRILGSNKDIKIVFNQFIRDRFSYALVTYTARA